MTTTEFPSWVQPEPDRTLEDWRRVVPEAMQHWLDDRNPSICSPEGESCDRVAYEIVAREEHEFPGDEPRTRVRWVCQHHSVKARAAGWITAEQ